MGKRLTAGILSGMLLLGLGTGCTESPKENTSLQESQGSSQSSTKLPQEETSKPYPFTFQPHVLSEEYKQAYGKEFEKSFYEFCDAVLAGEESFMCPDSETYYRIMEAAATCMPIADYYLEPQEHQPQNGVGKLEYSLERDAYLREVERFQQTVSDWITENLQEGDGDFEKVISLYSGFSQSVVYDYDALETEEWVDLSPYRALMKRQGICQEFVGAYAYLLMQAGVNSTGCGSLNRDHSAAHEWNMVQLDGKNYYLDTTFQNTTDPFGLQYFGMDEQRRDEAGDFDPADYNIANLNLYGAEDFPAKDRSFAPLWSAVRYELDRKNKIVKYYTDYETEHAEEFSYAAWN